MYPIYFYKDSKGREPVLEYLTKLSSNSSKDSRVKLNKIQDYIELLHQQGTFIGQPFVKYLGKDLWELRPLQDRIIFVAWYDGAYVLLHHFKKKSQKTPRKEIERAMRCYQDLQRRKEYEE